MKRRKIKILIITTSAIEFKFIQQTFKNLKSLDERRSIAEEGENQYVILRSDSGIFSFSYFLGRELFRDKYDIAINTGICGSFKTEFQNGTVLRVASDLFADIGTEDGKDLFDMGLIDENCFPFSQRKIFDNPGELLKFPKDIKVADAITVNRVSISEGNIAYLKTRYKPDIETMEGAMFFYICAMEKINFFQLRAVSNRVGGREKANWEIEKAMNALSEVLKQIIN